MAHLTSAQRAQLSVLVRLGKTQKEAAVLIGTSQSTVSRELRRLPGAYSACFADLDAGTKRAHAYNKRIHWFERNPLLLEEILKKLRERWSPEQIIGERKEQQKPSVSAKTLYAYIWKRSELHCSLRRKGRRHWPGSRALGRSLIPHRRDISTRPRSVERRRRYGDWESDLVIGKGHRGAIATFVERKSRYLRAVLLRDYSASTFCRAAGRAFGSLPLELRRTMTHDNGSEIASHERITRMLKITVYCASPYRAWERGLNEHTNGLLRDYYPKGTDFQRLTQEDLDRVVESINTRPRHCLRFRTPKMVFEKVRKKYAFHSSE